MDLVSMIDRCSLPLPSIDRKVTSTKLLPAPGGMTGLHRRCFPVWLGLRPGSRPNDAGEIPVESLGAPTCQRPHESCRISYPIYLAAHDQPGQYSHALQVEQGRTLQYG